MTDNKKITSDVHMTLYRVELGIILHKALANVSRIQDEQSKARWAKKLKPLRKRIDRKIWAIVEAVVAQHGNQAFAVAFQSIRIFERCLDQTK